MNTLLQKLMLGGSMAAMVAATSFATNSASAQDESPAAASIEQVVVTGTNFAGVAPVGSTVIIIDQQAMQASGAVDVEQAVTTLPALTQANGPPQGANANSLYQPQIHDVAGSVSNATLAIIDGLRVPNAAGNALADPGIIPSSAIERIEVLADGASSIYGSDAVSGVVNYITRKSYDGVQVDFQGGAGADYYDDSANLIVGTSWNTGSAYLAAGYLFESELTKASRSFISEGNYTSLGGSNYDEVFGCPTASMIVPGNTGVYLSPTSTTTVPNTQPSKSCDVQEYGAALPQEIRENGLVKVNQDFLGDKLTTSLTVDYGTLETQGGSIPGSLTSTTVYGPGSGKGGQINPFYQAPAGAPTATQETINWVDLMGNGPNGTNYGTALAEEDAFYSTLTATYHLTSTWDITLKDALSRDNYSTQEVNGFCTSCATLALNGTALPSASTTTTAIAGQNTISLNTPLTTSNALDIWDPAGSTNLTNTLVAKSLYNGSTFGDIVNTFNQVNLTASGQLFDLPAGPVRLALGAENINYHQFSQNVSQNGSGPLLNGGLVNTFRVTRTVLSSYGELNIPVISPDMNIPWVDKVDVDVSARYDDFSDVGPTFNPKYSLDWQVVDGFKLRANYNTSFVAPNIGNIGDPSQGGEYGGGASASASFSVPVAIYPTVTLLPGCAGVTTSCTIGSGTSAPGLKRQYGSALSGSVPQKGNGWTLGTDIAPLFLPGFTASVTYWSTNYIGGETAPSIPQIEGSSGLHNKLQLFPGGATQAQINAFTNVPTGGTVTNQPATVYFTFNADETNVLNLAINGVDLATRYTYPTGNFGTFYIGEAATIFTHFTEETYGTIDQWYNILGTSGINNTFPSVQTQSRMSAGWSNDTISVDMFWNFTSAYTNAGGTNVNPIILNAQGNYAGGGDHVEANNTFDIHVAYNFPDGWLMGDQVFVGATNIFDTPPPFYNFLNHDAFGTNGWNAFLSNPVGRVVSAGLRAKF